MQAATMQSNPADARIPVYLVTGFLGSGKTTLLARWLKEPLFADAALIVNEIGEVGIDHATLGYAGESSLLLADACVCCSGLPALHEALEELFWARLHRRMARFGSVVIETTGLADPVPLLDSLKQNAFVRQRYRVVGVFTTLGATDARETIVECREARAQLRRADLIVVTKVDRVTPEELAAIDTTLRRAFPATRITHSAHASLSAVDACATLQATVSTETDEIAMRWMPGVRSFSGAGLMLRRKMSASAHDAVTRFLAIDEAPELDDLRVRIDGLIEQNRASLLRLKGFVRLSDRTLVIAQFARGDTHVDLRHADMSATRAAANMASGVTLILQTRAAS